MKERKRQSRARFKGASRRPFDHWAASQDFDSNLRASEIPPGDTRLREFVADFYAAMSMMRILRQEIASTLSLTSAEYSVLLAVWYLERKKEITVRAIADHLHVAAAYVTSEVSRLVARGLLTKRRDKFDRRAVGVGLTKAARDLLSRLEQILSDINRPLFSGLSFRDLATVHRFLRAVIGNGHDAIRAAQGFESGLRPQGKAGSSGRGSLRRAAHFSA
jgi:DNA-binding MarR family transcriptional regulator